MGTKTHRAALYLRVSTGEQTTENQRLELQKRGWTVVATYEDAGISGAKGRDKRPGLDRLLKDAAAGKFDIACAWSLDRLGRSLKQLLETMDELLALGVGLYLHQQQIDSTTPAGKAMLQMCAVFAEFERAVLIERINAGLARARQSGTKSGRPLGRPRLAAALREAIRTSRSAGKSVPDICREHGISSRSVFRILAAVV